MIVMSSKSVFFVTTAQQQQIAQAIVVITFTLTEKNYTAVLVVFLL